MVIDEETASRNLNACHFGKRSSVIWIGRKAVRQQLSAQTCFVNRQWLHSEFLQDNVTISHSPQVSLTSFHLLVYPENLLSPLFRSLCVPQTPAGQRLKLLILVA